MTPFDVLCESLLHPIEADDRGDEGGNENSRFQDKDGTQEIGAEVQKDGNLPGGK